MAKREMIGQKFGLLTVLEDSHKRGSNGGIIWKCQCDCGNITEVLSGNLTRKKHPTQSCGCKTSSKNLVGKKFNKLTVIEKTDMRDRGRVVWKCQCDCGNIHYVQTGNLTSGAVASCGKCPKPKVEKRKILSKNEIIGQLFGCYKVIEDTGEHSDNYSLYLCECVKCGYKTKKTINSLKSLKGAYCSQCKTKDISGQVFGYLTAIEEYKKENRKSIWKCQCVCGKETFVSKSNLITGNTISCGCFKQSKGEMKIQNFLESKQINFETQKTFDTCIFSNTKQKARFDFYLPDYNLIIEYDGQQHFKEVEIFNQTLEEIQKKDKYKNEWCQKNNIKLIRIPYTDYNKIEDILTNFI